MSKDINQFIKDLFSTKFILPLVLILGFIFFFYLDLDSFLSWKNISANYSEIKLISQENILYSAFIFFLIHFLAIVLSVPIVGILLILGGALFGWLAVFLLLSSTLGCWVVFFAARGFLFEYLSKPKISKEIELVNQPGISSHEIQKVILRKAKELGFTDEKNGLFKSYSNSRLRPDFYLQIENYVTIKKITPPPPPPPPRFQWGAIGPMGGNRSNRQSNRQ